MMMASSLMSLCCGVPLPGDCPDGRGGARRQKYALFFCFVWRRRPGQVNLVWKNVKCRRAPSFNAKWKAESQKCRRSSSCRRGSDMMIPSSLMSLCCGVLWPGDCPDGRGGARRQKDAIFFCAARRRKMKAEKAKLKGNQGLKRPKGNQENGHPAL